MCWSFEVSVAAGSIAYTTALLLWTRNATVRDRWNAIFLIVFSTMQWVDAALWYSLNKGEVFGVGCSTFVAGVNIFGLIVIILEPVACLFGSMYARKEWFTRNEFLCYIVGNLSVQFFMGYVFIQPYCRTTWPCPTLTEHKHLLLTIGTGLDGNTLCWREYGFFGNPSYEIPLWLRFCYLAGMVYPYVVYMQPLGGGLVQSFVLTATWLVGYFSDSHASVWCLANVIQVVTMYLDPYMFTPPVTITEPKLRDFYNKNKASGTWDYIIVGSGIGGLSSGALLARAGYRVLILEQHYRVGGCTHEFKQKGDYFDSGIHYIGGSSFIRNMLSFITNKPGVALSQMGSELDGFLYDEFDLGDDLKINFRAGAQEMKKELLKHFPKEKHGIDLYFECIKNAQHSLNSLVLLKALPDWIARIGFVKRYLLSEIGKSGSITATEVINGCVQDKRLRALLSAGQLIDWNLKPDECSWAVVGGMANYYLDGGFYPVGGASTIAERIVPVIERAGGKVLVKARVNEFVLKNEKISGVKMENGDILESRNGVISDIGLVNTFKALPDSTLSQFGLSREIPGASPSNGHMTAFINLDGPPHMFDLRSANIHSWIDLPKFDHDPNKMQEAFYKDPLNNAKGCLMTLTCPCVKDPQYVVDQPNQSNVLLLTEAKWEWFADMNLEEVNHDESSTHGNRSEEYSQFKKKWEEIFLERLYKYYPKTKGHVSGIQIGTPVSSAHFIAADKGGSYGMAWSPAHFEEELLTKYLRVRSKIPGLYISGESALFGGFAGAMAGGYLCALKILGFFKLGWIWLTTEAVDGTRIYRRQDDAEPAMFLAVFASIVGVMLGGRRFGRALTNILAK